MEAAAFCASVKQALDDVQSGLLAEAEAFRMDNTVDVKSYEELKDAVAAGARRGG